MRIMFAAERHRRNVNVESGPRRRTSDVAASTSTDAETANDSLIKQLDLLRQKTPDTERQQAEK